jgi:exopolysaccharide biosynthesis polyprenyl glycosylphosphotransferase
MQLLRLDQDGSAPIAARRQTRAGGAARRRTLTAVGADVMTVVLSALLAVATVRALDEAPVLGRFFKPFEGHLAGAPVLFIILTPYWLAALWIFGLYREPARSISGMSLQDMFDGLTAVTTASWLLLMVLVFVEGTTAPVAYLIAFWAIVVMLAPAMRWLLRRALWREASFTERVLIVGAGDVGHVLAEKLGKHPEYHVDLLGFLDDGEPRQNGAEGNGTLPMLGRLADLERVIVRKRVDRVIVSFTRNRHSDVLHVVRLCGDHGVRVNVVPRLFEVVSSRAQVDDVEGIPLLDIGHVELGRFNMAVKRLFDLVIGGLLFILVLPLLAVLALLVTIDSPGPVFFRQERMGRKGETFRIYKFRSMKVGAETMRVDLAEQNEYSGPMFKMKEDPRVTRVGSWLRRWSLDELPQVLNVLKGDMSLVGPRPLWVDEAKQCRGWTQKRLDITPGITGLWQVTGRNDIPFDEMVKLDYMYVTGWSLSWDVKLLLQTLPAVLEKRGAY